MSELAVLRPLNEASERATFIEKLSKAQPYEPQLQYADPEKASAIRSACDQHLTAEFEALARTVVEGIHHDYGCEDSYCDAVWGRQLQSSEVDCACDAYLEQNNLHGKVLFEWSPNVLVTMCGVPKEGPGKVRLVTRPNYYRETRLASLLDHEVGTHYVRSHNHKQAYRKGRPPFAHRAGWLLGTEEGLATLNTNKAYADKRLWVPAIHYLATLLASRLPFSQLWLELGKYIGADDHERLWTICLRVKRGMTDTGQPGGYYKDGANWVGAVRLLRRRREIDFRLLHCVRVSIEDFPRAIGAARSALASGTVVLPAFVRDDAALQAYLAALDEIAAANGVDQLPPPQTAPPRSAKDEKRGEAAEEVQEEVSSRAAASNSSQEPKSRCVECARADPIDLAVSMAKMTTVK